MPSLRGGGAERTLINLLQKIDYSRYESRRAGWERGRW